MERSQVPFVAWESTKLRADQEPAPDHQYDPKRQLWIERESGRPLVSQRRDRPAATFQASEFGETLLTKTSEGVDQTESRPAIHLDDRQTELSASEFGETVLTRTHEGVDQSETIAPKRVV